MSGSALESVPTLAEWFETYLTGLTSHASKGTPHGYRGIFNRTMMESLGEYPLTSIARSVVTAWVAKMRKTETVPSRAAREKAIEGKVSVPEPLFLSTKTIKNAHGLLSGCLNAAVLEGHIPANPARGVKLPRDEQSAQREKDIFTYDEWQ